MATTADFVGRNCPHCGAIDSLETDDALGEVACTECALVVAMGLEENELTRYNQDATYDDADRHRDGDDAGTHKSMIAALNAASAAGASPLGAGGAVGVDYSKVNIHPSMLNCIRSLQKKSGAPGQVIGYAIQIAKRFVGGRRARGQRLEKQMETAAVCFLIAAEQLGHPVPHLELRYIDPSLGEVEFRRTEVVRELKMEAEEKRLKEVFPTTLLTMYILKLGLQVSLYSPHCKRLLEALDNVDALVNMTIVEKIIISVLLARTSRSFQWEGKPSYVSGDPTVETIYANFAARAHLDPTRVKKLMQTANVNIAFIVEAFEKIGSASAVNKTSPKTDAGDVDSEAPRAKRLKVEKS